MVYNKTKRGLEKAAGIVGVVVSALEILVLLIAMIDLAAMSAYEAAYYGYTLYGPSALVLILPIGFALASLILSALVIKTPVQPDGIVKQRNGLRICMLVFLLLDGQWVAAGLMIAVLCLKDVKPAVQNNQKVANVSVPVTGAEMPRTIDEKVAELKHLKELGVLDDDTYKKAINKILKDIL